MLSEYGAGSDLDAAIKRITWMPLARLWVLHRAACARHNAKIEGPSYVVQDMLEALHREEG